MSPTVVMDRRSRRTRIAGSLWCRWAQRPPRWLPLLEPLSSAIARADLRRRLTGRTTPPDRPRVVSVGALRAGGSGKTPVVLDLAEGLAATGRRIAVVTRGYGSAETGPVIVDAADGACGDEARMLAAGLTAAVIVQSRDRSAGLRLLRERCPDVDIVVLEDGHQCAGAGRHLDVLILDRWRVSDGRLAPETGLRLPWGPWREGASGAARADVWLLPMGEDEQPPDRWDGGPDILGFVRRPALPEGVAAPLGMPYGVVSGIASPKRFEADCAALCGSEPAVIARFDDHAAYTRRDVDALLGTGNAAGVGVWLTTAKDRVKLSSLWSGRTPDLRTVSLDLFWRGSANLAETVLSRLED